MHSVVATPAVPVGKVKPPPQGGAAPSALLLRIVAAYEAMHQARKEREAGEPGAEHRETIQRTVLAILMEEARKLQATSAKPIGVEVVGVVRQGGEDGPEVEWLLEGGLHAVSEGGGETYLMVSHEPITNDDGYGEVYRREGSPS